MEILIGFVHSGCQVIVFKRTPHTPGFDPDNRIMLWVKALIPSKNRGRDAVGLDPISSPRNRFLDDMLQKSAVSF